jgi:hemolysin activation/secretion protein
VGSVEVARPFNLDGRESRGLSLDWDAFTGSAFIDAATLHNRRAPQPGRDLISAGVSLAWRPSDALFARLTYAAALRHPPPVAERDIQDDGLSFIVTVRPLRWAR